MSAPPDAAARGPVEAARTPSPLAPPPARQDAGQPVQAGNAPDDPPTRGGVAQRIGQSGECVAVAGTGEAATAAVDPIPAPDARLPVVHGAFVFPVADGEIRLGLVHGRVHWHFRARNARVPLTLPLPLATAEALFRGGLLLIEEARAARARIAHGET